MLHHAPFNTTIGVDRYVWLGMGHQARVWSNVVAYIFGPPCPALIPTKFCSTIKNRYLLWVAHESEVCCIWLPCFSCSVVFGLDAVQNVCLVRSVKTVSCRVSLASTVQTAISTSTAATVHLAGMARSAMNPALRYPNLERALTKSCSRPVNTNIMCRELRLTLHYFREGDKKFAICFLLY